MSRIESLQNIEKLLQNRSYRLEKEMSPLSLKKLDQKVMQKLYSNQSVCQRKHPPSPSEVFNDYLCSFYRLMKKKTLIGLTMGIVLLVVAVWLQVTKVNVQKPSPSSQEATELDNLVAGIDQASNQAEQALSEFDEIDTTLDDEQKLASLIDNLLAGNAVTTEPADTAPTTTDLDALLNAIDSAADAADNAVSDLDSIQAEDSV